MDTEKPKPSDLERLLAVASRGARVQVAPFTGLTAALHFSNEEGLRLAAQAPDMADELIRLRERLGELECALEAERHKHHPSGKDWAYFCWPARWYARALLNAAEPSAERSARLLAEAPDDPAH